MQEKNQKTEMSNNSSKFEEYFSKFLKGKEKEVTKATKSFEENEIAYTKENATCHKGILWLSNLLTLCSYLGKDELEEHLNKSDYSVIYNDLDENSFGRDFHRKIEKTKEQKLKDIKTDFIEKIRDILRKKYEEMKLAEKNETKPADPHQKDFEMLIGIFLKDNLKNGTFKRPDKKDQLDFLFETKDGKKFGLNASQVIKI